MSQRIRSLTPKACPACGTVGQLARIKNQIVCQQCGYTPSRPHAASPFTAPITSLGDDEVDRPQTAANTTPSPITKLKKIQPSPTATERKLAAVPKKPVPQKPAASAKPAPAPQKPGVKTPGSPYSPERLEELKQIPVVESIAHPEPISS